MSLQDAPARTQQHDLFADSFAELRPPSARRWPDGLRYQPEFLSFAEETELLRLVASLPLAPALYKEYTARRRVLSFGGALDEDASEADRRAPKRPLIEALQPLRGRVAAWLGVAPGALVHAMVAEYQPGTPLGWHRDMPDFEAIVGVSLGTPATLRLRPWPPVEPKRADVLKLVVAPRSIYRMEGTARWGWQHSVAPTPELRWSITWRTARAAGGRAMSLD